MWGFGPTELRIVIVIGAIRAALSPWADIGTGQPVRLFDVGGIVAAMGLMLAFVAASVGNARALYRAEPVPPRSTAVTAA